MYEYKAILKKLVDGDTMDLIIDVGFKMTTTQRVRLKGVNTPETWRRKKTSDEYKKGMAAKKFVANRFKENKNTATIKSDAETGVYGRYIVEVLFEDSKTSLNDELIQKRHATPWK